MHWQVGRKAMGFVTVWERAASAPGNLTMPNRASTSRDNQRVRDPTLNSACELDASCDRLRKLYALVSLHSRGSRGMWPRRGGTVPVWLARRPVVLHHSPALDRSRSASRPRYRIRSSPWPAVRMSRHPSDKCITDRRELARRTGRATQGWPPEPSRGRASTATAISAVAARIISRASSCTPRSLLPAAALDSWLAERGATAFPSRSPRRRVSIRPSPLSNCPDPEASLGFCWRARICLGLQCVSYGRKLYFGAAPRRSDAALMQYFTRRNSRPLFMGSANGSREAPDAPPTACWHRARTAGRESDQPRGDDDRCARRKEQ